MADKKISSFKKFSEMLPEDKTGMPLLPNDDTKREVTQSTRYLKPKAQSEEGNDYTVPELEENSTDESVEFIGKVAKMPKGVKASKGLNFLENVKIPKSSIWYIVIEKQDNELQTLKYNLNKGFNLGEFANQLKAYYSNKFSKNPKIIEKINMIEITGDDKYSSIKNIPLVAIDGKKLISIITEDLIKLLSK